MQENNSKKVSVIIPTYNGGKYIIKAIESVLSQTFKDFEIIVVDDGSTEDIYNVVKSYIDKNQIKYIKQKNAGPGSARKNGILNSNGKYIAFLDDDDIWIDKDKLKKQIEFLENNNDYVMIGTNGLVMDENYNKISNYNVLENNKDIKKVFLWKNSFIQSSVVVRRDVLNSVHSEEVEKYKIAEDYYLWLELGLKGKVANLPDEMVSYMYREENTSFINKKYILKSNIKIIKNYKDKYPNFSKGLIISYLKYFTFSVTITLLSAKFYKILFKLYRKFI